VAYYVGFGKQYQQLVSTIQLGATMVGGGGGGGSRLFTESVYDTIQQGKIAVIPEFLSQDAVSFLKRDANDLYDTNFFSTDALASYGTAGKFDPSKDRTVLKLNQWKNTVLGDWNVRKQFGARVSDLRYDLARNLNRPGLVQGISMNAYGEGSAEISYTRFGPGAYLQRHVDEHHEELKGVAGWSQPTRRSLSWLIYLNENWNADKFGGSLRCYERASGKPSHSVGARPNGDLQIGWLRPSLQDPVERPVFLDAQFDDDGDTDTLFKSQHYCALYIDDPTMDASANPSDQCQPYFITPSFHAHPTLFMAGGEFLTQKFLVHRKDYSNRFHLIESPKSIATDWLHTIVGNSNPDDEVPVDVAPLAGTLVVFDSVTLPHQVLPSMDRARWATSGWMHEDQQQVQTHPLYNRDLAV
jgi:hypothetical protein